MAWQVTGQLHEICSCTLLCSCWLSPDIAPDQGWCSGIVLFEIAQGNSEEVDLRGCRTALAVVPRKFLGG